MPRTRNCISGFLTAALLLVVALPAAAREAAPVAADPQLEKRVMSLAEELRCLVCQNQTLAGSNADLAVDLRNQIREQLKNGKSEQDVIDFMVARYGDFVRYRPPLKATTLLLWFGPLLLAVLGIGMLVRRLNRRRAEAPAALSDAERKRAETLLKGGAGRPR
ncbi:MAG: cytochrome c-type biogenesis protein CcmH [Betaproteobacteria bacterium]|nr:cytochrome c-type biogenesis protein CcmH [Betaproteobacteria bacterium]